MSRQNILLTVVFGLNALLCGPALAEPDPVSAWNSIAVQATLTAGENAVVQSRTLAIMHIAIHDSLNSIDHRYARYAFTGALQANASPDAAIAAAARTVLVNVIQVGALPFSGFGTPDLQALAASRVETAYVAALDQIPEGPAKYDGIAIGSLAAMAILALRKTDHATEFASYVTGSQAGDWQPTPDPVPFDPPVAADLLPAALPGWGKVTPFVLRRSTAFEPGGPPSLSSVRYARDYNEVKSIGAQFSVTRTAEQSTIARFWYENSGATWSRIALQLAQSRGLNTWATARLLALVNLAMADGFIAGFATKYDFNFWRPITAIRAGDTDGNSATTVDPNWSSFLNTPAHPDYPSTHSVVGGAASEVIRRFFNTDDAMLTITSGPPFAGIVRSFDSLSQAARENAASRVYAGIHFRSAVEDGIKQGRQIGAYTFNRFLRPEPDDFESRPGDR
jgi:hypothetical protein